MRISIDKEIDVVEGISRKQFEDNYYYPQKPVVIKGLVNNFPAHKKWSFDFFSKEMGGLEVGIFDASLERPDRAYKTPDYTLPFREYLKEIQQGPTKKRLFLFNPFKHNPSLLSDFEFPKLCGGFIKSFPFMFFGGDGSITRAHQDVDMSCIFLTQFEGKKKVLLIDPKYSELLYRLPFNVHTPADLKNPDFEKFPGLKYVKGIETTLSFGDTLFIPSGWWHHIEYVGSGFSMSLRCLSPNKLDWLKGGWKVGVISTMDDFIRKGVGEKAWFEYKERKAIQRAKNAVRKIQAHAI